MEVHAHTHTARKKWTHYIWEFLMLFLAVFCGFLAEYQLEHVIENQREKQFIESIIIDLSQDTTALNVLIADYERKGKELDTLMFLLNAPNIKENGALIYYKGRLVPRIAYFNPIDRTILQMKNSGGFRLIRNKTASTSILNYYASINFLEQIQNINRQQAETYRNITLDVFDPMVFEAMLSDITPNVKIPANNPSLLSYDKKLLSRLTGAVHYFNSLISLLKHEYHLN